MAEQRFEYQVTVIVPVYNAEKTLGRTMDSLFAQTMPQGGIEILLVDDGSKDGSPALCDAYAKEHGNVRVIHQANQGVSAARNAGIRAAKGKYLLYLDGDDTLSSETLENLVKFFDEHYDEVDIVTYPLMYQYENNTTELHWRYTKYLTQTGVYPLDKNPYIVQTTINVCVKNCADKVLFDETMELVEDQLHNMGWLKRTGKLGYVREAQYNYIRAKGSSSSLKGSPMFSYDAYNAGFQEFLAIGEQYPQLRDYCHCMILYNINWRISTDVLLPYHLSGDAYEKGLSRLAGILDQIPNRTILAYPNMDPVYKWYLLSLKRTHRPFIIADRTSFAAVDVRGQLAKFSDMLAVISRSRVEGGTLHLTGHIKCLVTPFLYEPLEVYAVINGYEKLRLDTFSSGMGHYYSKMKTGEFRAFHLDLPLEGVSDIAFKVSLRGYEYPAKFWFTKTQGLRQDKRYYLTDGTYQVTVQNDALQVRKGRFAPSAPRANLKVSMCRALMGRRHERIWLYSDRNGIYDNAYIQFCHDFDKKDGVKRYYVYDDESSAVEGRFSAPQRKYLVRFGSPKHKILYSDAEYILTSFVDAVYYRPFDLDTFAFYRGKCPAKVVYLQHGVLHAKAPHYNKERLEIDKVVVSGAYERELFVNECGFQPEDLIESGMPRLDSIPRGEAPEKKILYAPSWREYLSNGLWDLRWQPVSKEQLKKSAYYQGIVQVLKNQTLRKALKANGYTIELKLHPIFEMYQELFQEELPDVCFRNGTVALEEYAGFLTDFSSFLYDFAYLNRPIFYFVPDIQEFRSGMNGYRELYIPLEEGLGEFSTDADEIAGKLARAMEKGLRVEPLYKERMDRIFSSYEADHAETLYQALMGGK